MTAMQTVQSSDSSAAAEAMLGGAERARLQCGLTLNQICLGCSENFFQKELFFSFGWRRMHTVDIRINLTVIDYYISALLTHTVWDQGKYLGVCSVLRSMILLTNG